MNCSFMYCTLDDLTTKQIHTPSPSTSHFSSLFHFSTTTFVDLLSPVMVNSFSPDLALLFSHLLSTSNSDREAAEETLLCLSKNHPESLCLKTSLLLCSPLSDLRFMAAIFLRQFLTPTSDFYLWSRLSPFCQFYLRIILLLSLEEERIRYVANAKSDTIAELASHLVPLYPQYPELLPFVFAHMAKNEPQILVEANLRIFSRIAKPLDHILIPIIPNVRSILSTCITHPTSSLDVCVAALSASCSLVQSIPPENQNELRSLLNFFRYVLLEAIHRKEPAAMPKVLQLLIDFAGADPNFFRSFVQDLDIVMGILALAESDLVKEGTRYLALEFAITLAEARKQAAGTACKISLRVPQFFAILMKMLLDVSDNMACLGAQPEGHEPNQSAKHTIVLEYLDRLVSALGGNEVLKAAVDVLPAYLTDPGWNKRHVAFIALARISAGCSEDINFECLFHGMVVDAFGAAMDDFENPCMQAAAAMAFMNFIDKCNDDILILMPRLDQIVEKLVLLIKEGKQMVQERAVSALAIVAELVSDKFMKYHDVVVPQLLHILMDVTNKTNKMLLAKLADCISVFGLTAGKGKFGKHARKVMEVLISLHSSFNPLDPVTKYVLQATDAICRCLGRDFLPYMDTLIKLLLESVQLKPDYGVASAYPIADLQHFDDMRSETSRLRIRRKRIRLGNSFLERKVLACDILLTYLEVLQEHFFPWIKKVTLALAPLIKFEYHVNVRKFSAAAMPKLLNSAKMAIEMGISQDHEDLSIKQLFGFILPELLDGIHKEQDLETCAIFLGSLVDCLQLSARYLKAYQIRNIMEEIKYLIALNDAKSRKRENIKTEDYYGEEAVINKENKLEDVLLEQIAACLAILIDTCRTVFLPFFDELSNHIISMLVSEESIQKRKLSLLIFDDIAEKCGYAAVRYYDEYLPHLLVACNDNNPSIRQNGVYGVGICAKFGGSGFVHFLSEALAKINNIIQSPNALAPSNALAYDNAVATLGWICKFHKFRTRAKAIVAWLNCLPVRHDREEALVVHELLCSMVESSDRQLLGENNKHLAKVISILIEILSSDENLATKDTHNRMVKILKGLKNTMPRSTLDGMLLSLSSVHQHALRAILSTKGLATAVHSHKIQAAST